MIRTRGLGIGVVMAMLGLFTASAQGGTVYVVDAGASSATVHNSGNGLLLDAAIVVPDGLTFELNGVGDSETFTFLKVWSPEDWVNVGEDTEPKPISATLAFSSPASSGTVAGESVGLSTAVFGIDGFYQAGQITWGGPVQVDVSTGTYEIALNDVTFGESLFWLGLKGCGYVDATVTQLTVGGGSGDPQIIVPLPTAVWSGLILIGALVGRRAMGNKHTA